VNIVYFFKRKVVILGGGGMEWIRDPFVFTVTASGKYLQNMDCRLTK
jgi:hypothetical protein